MTSLQELDRGSREDLERIQAVFEDDPAIAIDRLESVVEIISDDVVDSQKNIEKFAKYKKEGLIQVIYSDHSSLTDIVPIGMVVSDVIEAVKPDDFRIDFPISTTLGGGEQGIYAQSLLRIISPYLGMWGFGEYLEVITKNDREIRGISGTNEESTNLLKVGPALNWGLFVFPEASLEGGRKGPDGKIKGLQELDPTEAGGLLRLPNIWLRNTDRDTGYLPVGVAGTPQLLSPMLGARIPTNIIEIIEGKRDPVKLVEVRVAPPFTRTQFEEEVGGKPNPINPIHRYRIMDKVANVLPYELRGRHKIPFERQVFPNPR